MSDIEPQNWVRQDADALEIWRSTAKRLERADLLEGVDTWRLGAYALCAARYRQARRGHLPGARVWKGGSIYARNGLGLHKPIFIDYLDLLMDEGGMAEPVTPHISPDWQIDRPANYLTAPYPY